jgi:hypothetical protein
MPRFAPLLTVVVVAGCGGSGHVRSAHGVSLELPHGWHRVAPAGDAPVTDPRTLLVAGTGRIGPRSSACQIPRYRVPADGAVVVVVGWKHGGTPANRPGRAPLRALRTVRRAVFECWPGRGAGAQVTLGGRVYQVNVMVGDRATQRTVQQALAVGRSFDRLH